MAQTSEVTVQQVRAMLAVGNGSTFDSVGDTSRQAVYQMIARLDDAIFDGSGLTVVARGGHGLTSLGRQLLPEAAALVDAWDRFLARAKELAASPMVEVSCLPAHVGLVDAATSAWRRVNARATTHYREVDDAHRADQGRRLKAQVNAGQIDIAIVSAPGAIAGMATPPMLLYKWPIVVVVAHDHPWRNLRSIELKEIANSGMPILASPRSHSSRRVLDAAGTSLRVGFPSPSADALVERARRGNGAALVAGDAIPVRAMAEAGASFAQVCSGGSPMCGETWALVSRQTRPAVVDFLVHLRDAGIAMQAAMGLDMTAGEASPFVE
jgi:DNA-binding transcriptional LysR family regulator